MSAERDWIESFVREGAGSDLETLLGREDLRVMPLQRNALGLLDDLPRLGVAAYTTRNSCVTCTRQEAVRAVLPLGGGTTLFGEGRGLRHVGLVWSHAAAVLSRGADFSEAPPCLLFFGETGDLAHQITLSDPAAWEAFLDLVRKHQGCWNCLRQRPASLKRETVFDCPARTLREAWCEARSEADLDARMEGLGLKRIMALRALEGLFTTPMGTEDLAALLEAMRESALSVHVEMGNRHCTQVIEGPLGALDLGPSNWEIQMAEATLRFDPVRMDSLWSVVRPGPEGEQRRFECYDAHGEQVLALSVPHQSCPLIREAWQGMLAQLDRGMGANKWQGNS